MPLTPNQRRFLQQQLSLWGGLPVDFEMPAEYAAIILGLTEAGVGECDKSGGNYEYQHNPLFWSGRYLEPVINQWLQEQIGQLPQAGNTLLEPLWPQDKKFAVCLTHDVDHVTLFSLRAFARAVKRSFVMFPKHSTEIMNNIRWSLKFTDCSLHNLYPQKINYFEPWLALEDRYGFRSTFFFFPDRASRYHLIDSANYSHQDRLQFEGQQITVSELMQEIARRGWEVGLHGSYYSFDDAEEFKRQKEQVEHSLGKEIVSVRQHGLHFDITKTPNAQSAAGFKYDSTMGSNRMTGFRNGIAFPFYHYDLISDTPLPLLQIPLHIQDAAMYAQASLGLSPSLALMHCKELIDKVEATGGLITLLWHPDVCHEGRFPGWFRVYEELLSYIADKNAWVAPVVEVGRWWEQRRLKLLSLP
jgi:peptidoglycan/xylan/chitin deacetylase (PgdA/CDA1 family)